LEARRAASLLPAEVTCRSIRSLSLLNYFSTSWETEKTN
jgi:hypothetical protein